MKTKQTPVVAITGGSMGLGLALCRVLLHQGFRVAMCARRPGPLEEALKQLRPLGEVTATVGDISDEAFRQTWLQRVLQNFGQIDALVNNASTLGEVPLPQLVHTHAANLSHVLQVNTVSPLLLAQSFLAIRETQADSTTTNGLLLNISSDAAVGGYANWGVYGASKAALELLTKTLANEVQDRVQIHAVDPGDMHTAMHSAAAPEDTGLTDPLGVAEALLPLFLPLLTNVPWPFANGKVLHVAESGLGPSLTLMERGLA